MDKVKKEKLLEDLRNLRLGTEVIHNIISENREDEIERYLNMLSYGLNRIRTNLNLEDENSMNQRKCNMKVRESNQKIHELEKKLAEKTDVESSVLMLSDYKDKLREKFGFMGYVKELKLSHKSIVVEFSIMLKGMSSIDKMFIDTEEELQEKELEIEKHKEIIKNNFQTEKDEILYNDFNKQSLEKYFSENIEYETGGFEVKPSKYRIEHIDTISFYIDFNNIKLIMEF